MKSPAGAYFQTDGKNENLILRKCLYSDGAEPSGNAVQCENLLRLWEITFDKKYLHAGEDILKAVKKYVDNYPPGYTYHMMNLNRYYDKDAPQITIALDSNETFKNELVKELSSHYIPHKSVIWRHADDEKLFEISPSEKLYIPINNHTTLYICRRGVCQQPITDFKTMFDVLHKL